MFALLGRWIPHPSARIDRLAFFVGVVACLAWLLSFLFILKTDIIGIGMDGPEVWMLPLLPVETVMAAYFGFSKFLNDGQVWVKGSRLTK